MRTLIVPFAEKDAAKNSGCKWSVVGKYWYSTGSNPAHDKWIPVYLDVPFRDKDEAKSKGCVWNKERRQWCINSGNYTPEFDKWAEKRKIYLKNIPFEFKDALKECFGGKWDSMNRQWYVYEETMDEVLNQYVCDSDNEISDYEDDDV
jgi:hypothetical protein